MDDQETTETGQTSRTGTKSKDPIAGSDDLIIPGDRLLARVAWDLRDEQSEVTAYETAVDALTDRKDFTSDDIDALEAALRDRFSPRRDEQALTLRQTALIAEKAQFALDHVETLSRELAAILDPTKSPFVLHVPRRVAVNRGAVKLREVHAQIFSACDLLTSALETAETLDTSQAKDRDGAEKLNTLRREHEDATLLLEALHRKYGILAEQPDCALDLSPENRRTISDERRKMILFRTFDFWAAQGRSLKTTTDPKTKNLRKGPLYEFVNAIVVCLNDPGVTLSGHTIFDDLKEYKATKKRQ